MNTSQKVGTFTLDEKEREAVGTQYETVEVTIRYEIGGFGGMDWQMRKRGYQLSVTPCRVVQGNGYTRTESVLLGGYGAGGFVFIEEAKRRSDTRLQALANSVDLAAVKTAFINKDVQGMRAAVRAHALSTHDTV